MKIRTIASGLTHLLFTSLIALAAAKSAPDTAPAEADSAPEKPTRTAETQIASQPASMIDAHRAPEKERPRSIDEPAETAAPEDRAPAPSEPAPVKTETPAEPTPNQRLMRRLVAAYPDFLAGYEDNTIIWHDGTRMTFDDGRDKDFKQRLNAPDLEDQFYAEYPRGLRGVPPLENIDPGRGAP